MTNHWRDIKNADLILINGGNPAEAHPVGFRWFVRAKLERGAKIIHVDPRFTRTSAVADIHLRIRTGSENFSWPIAELHDEWWNAIRHAVESDSAAGGIPSL